MISGAKDRKMNIFLTNTDSLKRRKYQFPCETSIPVQVIVLTDLADRSWIEPDGLTNAFTKPQWILGCHYSVQISMFITCVRNIIYISIYGKV